MNITRRTVLRGFAGLAATALVPALTLVKEMRSGVIRNQFFQLDGPVILENINDLLIENCVFYFPHLEPDQLMLDVRSCRSLTLINCCFTAQPDRFLAFGGIHITSDIELIARGETA